MMIDFAATELYMETTLLEKEREIRAIAEASAARNAGNGFRTALAARLARLAFRLDGETAHSQMHGVSATGRRA